MVEMLGVLAIMGILSIGGVAGYRYGMDKHRANATMNDINLRGVDLIIQDGTCYSCDEANSVGVYDDKENCAVCDNRVVGGSNNHYCAPSECPADKPLLSSGGTCYSCDEVSPVFDDGVTGNCTECENRVVNGDYCFIPCPADKPLIGMDGTCYSCGEASGVNVRVSPESCSLCDNRILKGNSCYLKCPSDKPLMDSNGDCYSCNYQYGVYVYGVTGNCAVCKDRVLNGDYCALK